MTSTALVDQLAHQRAAALRQAQRTRLAIVKLKREIHRLPEADGRGVVIAVLNDPDETVRSARLDGLLLAIYRFGGVKTRRVFYLADIHHPDKRVRDLTDRQRDVICELLADPKLIQPGSGLPVIDARPAGPEAA